MPKLFHFWFVVQMCIWLSFIKFGSSNGILSLIFLNIGNVEFFWCHGWLLDHLDFYVSICTSILWLYSWIRVKISFTIVFVYFYEGTCVGWGVHQGRDHSKSAISVFKAIVGYIKHYHKRGFWWYQGSLVDWFLIYVFWK